MKRIGLAGLFLAMWMPFAVGCSSSSNTSSTAPVASPGSVNKGGLPVPPPPPPPPPIPK
jgi:hypothetical protein